MICPLVSLFSPLNSVVCNVELATGFNTSAVNQRTPGNGEQVWTLYGLFQFGNRLACRDNTTSSPNVCQEDCNSEFQFIFIYTSLSQLVCADGTQSKLSPGLIGFFFFFYHLSLFVPNSQCTNSTDVSCRLLAMSLEQNCLCKKTDMK